MLRLPSTRHGSQAILDGFAALAVLPGIAVALTMPASPFLAENSLNLGRVHLTLPGLFDRLP
jgi:hypothetical protein